MRPYALDTMSFDPLILVPVTAAGEKVSLSCSPLQELIPDSLIHQLSLQIFTAEI